MEKYLVIDSFEKGPQGSALLVKHRPNRKAYILKKIECNDDTEANRALIEVMQLSKLKHRHVATPRDAFLHWEPTESAIYLCIVTDYFVTGDLDSYLKEKSRKGNSICEMDFRRWSGQLLHALTYLHDNGITHTNLKPSNIYLTPKIDVCIGDIEIRTVTEDLHRFRSRTRSAVWALYWMPPEIFDGPHGPKTDVWSLGCFLYEVAVMAQQGVLKSRDVLLELRKGNASRFLESLEMITCENSTYICDCIRLLLSGKHENRPTIRDALKLPYPRLCVELVTSQFETK